MFVLEEYSDIFKDRLIIGAQTVWVVE